MSAAHTDEWHFEWVVAGGTGRERMIDGLCSGVYKTKTTSAVDGTGEKSQDRRFVTFDSVNDAKVIAFLAVATDHYRVFVVGSNFQLAGN